MADDVVVITEHHIDSQETIDKWKEGKRIKGFRINVKKPEVMSVDKNKEEWSIKRKGTTAEAS